ncbi:MAG: hypothetical protein ABIY70_25805 [Capsulimonas sp.]|uniref:hypothetical protein n=1 Tax=Capsulimonas sp. TaxID=2494211 RepID=UPI003267D61D
MSHFALTEQNEPAQSTVARTRVSRPRLQLVLNNNNLLITCVACAHQEQREISVAPNTLTSATVRQIQAKLNSLFEPTESRRWLEAKLPILEDRSPLELIEAGQSIRLLHMLIRLEEGTPS